MFLQPIVQSTMAISGVSMQRIGNNCRADFVLRILRSALVWMSKNRQGFTIDPSRKGLDRLNISGSAEFSVGEFEKLVSVLKKQANGPIYIVDLRQETHGIFNGNAVSWFGARDWGNIGKNKTDVLKDEMRRLCAAKGKSLIVTMLDEGKKSIAPKLMKISSVMSEGRW